MGESGADTFTIMRIMGHSRVTVSQRYAHPTPQAPEHAFEQLDATNQKVVGNLTEGPKGNYPLESLLQLGGAY